MANTLNLTTRFIPLYPPLVCYGTRPTACLLALIFTKAAPASDPLCPAGAVAELIHLHVELVENAQQQIARGHGAAGKGHVPVALQAPVGTADQHVRYVIMQMLIG